MSIRCFQVDIKCLLIEFLQIRGKRRADPQSQGIYGNGFFNAGRKLWSKNNIRETISLKIGCFFKIDMYIIFDHIGAFCYAFFFFYKYLLNKAYLKGRVEERGKDKMRNFLA